MWQARWVGLAVHIICLQRTLGTERRFGSHQRTWPRSFGMSALHSPSPLLAPDAQQRAVAAQTRRRLSVKSPVNRCAGRRDCAISKYPLPIAVPVVN
jgi:hypothetical protein